LKIKSVFCCTCLSLLFSIGLQSQEIDASRLVNWDHAGLTDNFEISNLVLNFVELGGDPSGQNSNSDLLSELINMYSANGVEIFFPDGEYFFDQSIYLNSNIQLTGSSTAGTQFIFDLQGTGNCFNLVGTAEATSTFVTADVAFKDNALQVSSHELSNGDHLVLNPIDTHFVTSSWAEKSTGQCVTVASADINNISLNEELRRAYSSEYPIELIKLEPIKNVSIENLTIVRVDSTEQQTSNIYIRDAYNCNVSCIESYDCNFAHITIHRSHHIKVKDCFFKDAHAYGGGGQGYGVVLQFAASDCLITENSFDHLRHSLLLQAGPNGNVCSYNYSTNPFWVTQDLPEDSAGDLVLHGNYPYANLFEGNVVQTIVIDRSHGKSGPLNTFFRNRAELYGLFMSNSDPTNRQNFIGNEISNYNSDHGLYYINGEDHYEYGNHVQDDIFPFGTDNMTISSLYQNDVSSFYITHNAWPPIGLPNLMNEHKIKVQSVVDNTSLCDAINDVIPSPQDLDDIIVFPNPVNGILSIVGIAIEEIDDIIVFNAKGQIVVNFDSPASTKMNLSSLQSGIYFLKIRNKKGVIYRKPLVKI